MTTPEPTTEIIEYGNRVVEMTTDTDEDGVSLVTVELFSGSVPTDAEWEAIFMNHFAKLFQTAPAPPRRLDRFIVAMFWFGIVSQAVIGTLAIIDILGGF